MNELISIQDSTIGGQPVNTVNARDLHAFLEAKQDFSSWVKVQLERARLLENRDYILLTKKGEQIGRGGHNRVDVYLTLDAGKHVAMLSGTEKGFEVREYFIECERNLRAVSATLPDFTDPAAAAIAWAEQYRARQIAEQTKAEIGSRREATSMATASSAVRKAQRLEAQLDMLKQYITIKRMEKLTHGLKFSWRELKSASSSLGLPPVEVFDQNYGSVKAYHRDVWRAVYALDADGEQSLPEIDYTEGVPCQLQ